MGPPLDLVARGLRLVLTSNAGVDLADLTAPAGPGWSVNRTGTAWKIAPLGVGVRSKG